MRERDYKALHIERAGLISLELRAKEGQLKLQLGSTAYGKGPTERESQFKMNFFDRKKTHFLRVWFTKGAFVLLFNAIASIDTERGFAYLLIWQKLSSALFFPEIATLTQGNPRAPAASRFTIFYSRSKLPSWKSNEDFSTGTWQASGPTKSWLKTKKAVWCLAGMVVMWNKLATCSTALLEALCFRRFVIRAPLLDGSTVLTNICTDIGFHWDDETSRARSQKKIKLSMSCQLSPHCSVDQQPLATQTRLERKPKTTQHRKLWGDV